MLKPHGREYIVFHAVIVRRKDYVLTGQIILIVTQQEAAFVTNGSQ